MGMPVQPGLQSSAPFLYPPALERWLRAFVMIEFELHAAKGQTQLKISFAFMWNSRLTPSSPANPCCLLQTVCLAQNQIPLAKNMLFGRRKAVKVKKMMVLAFWS